VKDDGKSGDGDGIGPKDIALAVQHPRGTEQRRLGPYRAALNDLAAYAALPIADLLFDAVERAQLSDLFDELGPEAPTLLAPWTTRDLAAHLVLRERDYLAGPT